MLVHDVPKVYGNIVDLKPKLKAQAVKNTAKASAPYKLNKPEIAETPEEKPLNSDNGIFY